MKPVPSIRYRKISPRVWNDTDFRRLNESEKLIAFYCLTAQCNRIGIFNFSCAKAAEDLETLPPTFDQRFANVCKTLDWTFDSSARVLYIPTWWKYNKPENPNVLKSNLEDLAELPQTVLLYQFANNLAHLHETLHVTFTQTLAERYPQRSPQPMADQEQEQEQEQEQDKQTSEPSVRGGERQPPEPQLFATGKPKPNQTPEQKAIKRDAATKRVKVRDWWLEAWKRSPHGGPYVFTTDDWRCAKALADSMTAVELPVLWFVMLLYLKDPDPALAKAGHPFAWLRTRVNKYIGEAQERFEQGKTQEQAHGHESEQEAHDELARLESETRDSS